MKIHQIVFLIISIYLFFAAFKSYPSLISHYTRDMNNISLKTNLDRFFNIVLGLILLGWSFFLNKI